MARVYKRFSPNVQVRHFADQRINELEKTIEEAQAEKEMWERIRESTTPCVKCNGYGEIRVIHGQDSSGVEPCLACNGTGNQ